MTTRPDSSSTAVLVVTHSPDAEFPARLERVGRNGCCTVVVDNRSDPDADALVREACRRASATLISNETNLGLATALNQGFEWALSRGMRWALAFDQDSEPEAPFLSVYQRVFEEFRGGRRIAMIGATFPPLSPAERSEREWLETKTIITSGALHSLEAFAALGRFRDDFFIDFVDLEYVIRARARGFAVLKSLRAPLRHRLGAPTDHHLFGRPIKVSNHSATRRYYRMRNCTVVAKAYLREDPEWIARLLWRQWKSLLFVALFEEHRREKLAWAARGLIDGLRGRLGPIRTRDSRRVVP